MARSLNRLSARRVATLTVPGYYADGAGLYLQVSRTGARSWIFRFTLAGRAREMGLGPLHTVNLAQARDAAAAARRQLQDGIDPIDARRSARNQVQQKTFDECAAAYIEAHRAGWKNAKHAEQWVSTLGAYASPGFGRRPVGDVDTAAVLAVLSPIWGNKTETATRVRARIAAVLDWAAATGMRSADNPARWRGHLDKLLPRPSRVRKVKHFAALPYEDAPAFLARLRTQPGRSARALEFCILTATRTGEVLGAEWSEILGDVWTIPASRMKAGKRHEVPLTLAAAALLDRPSAGLIFTSEWSKGAMSENALSAVLKRMGRADITVHGFRSTFRDWAAEQTEFSRDVAEACLAHAIKDKTEAAYRRGSMLEKRRALMQVWAAYLMSHPAAPTPAPQTPGSRQSGTPTRCPA